MSKDTTDLPENEEIPSISDESDLGAIKINNSVVANIAKLAALKVVGVHAVVSGFYDGISKILSKPNNDSGVKVMEDEASCYVIDLRVIMDFGVELANVAAQAQKEVKEQVEQMTHNPVSRVNIYVEDVKVPESTSTEGEGWNAGN